MCASSQKKKLDGGGSQKVLVITESIRRLVIEVHRIVALWLYLAQSTLLGERLKVQLAMAGGMDVFIYGPLLFVRPYH